MWPNVASRRAGLSTNLRRALSQGRIQAAGIILGKKRIRKVRNDYTNEPLPILEDRCRLKNKKQVRTAKSRNRVPIFRGVIVRLE